MVIVLRKITDLGTPEEKVEDTRIADVHFVDRSPVPAITYHCDRVPGGVENMGQDRRCMGVR